MSKSLGNIISPEVIINGGHNQKQDPPYGADVLRLWVSSVDYSTDVQIGPGILQQMADVYRKVRNTARYLLGNLYDFDPSQHAVAITELPLLDRWMLQQAAEITDGISIAFDRFQFCRFFQLLQSFCVVDLSSFYLDIAKDRLYISGANDYRRRSCQTVISLIAEHLAGLIAPVLCHMAEDIWQNIPYPIGETSVFRRGWPLVPDSWRDDSLTQPVRQLRRLRVEVNRALENCRSRQELGASLEAAVRVEVHDALLQQGLDWLIQEGNPEVDSLKDWLLVSQLQLGGEPWAELLANQSSELATIEIATARGRRCDRCWHYEHSVGSHSESSALCRRCVDILKLY